VTTDKTALAAHLATMLDVAPCDWWRFVGCGYCMARASQPCVQCGPMTDGLPAPRPHARRYRLGLALHGTVWLLANHPGDVLGESADSEGVTGARNAAAAQDVEIHVGDDERAGDGL